MRTVWGIVIVAVVVASIFNMWTYAILSLFIGLGSTYELSRMYKVPPANMLLSFMAVYIVFRFLGAEVTFVFSIMLLILTTLRLNPSDAGDKRFMLAMLFTVYIAMASSSLVLMRSSFESPLFVLSFWLALWVFDSTAYLWGRFFGSEKFAPFISPGKNLEGFAFGYITTILACTLLSVMLKAPFIAAFGILVPLAGISGDLLESWAKRIAGVKDSGKLIPYHGGIWDRFDSSLLASMTILAVMKWL